VDRNQLALFLRMETYLRTFLSYFETLVKKRSV
jgi:hypothetical protein